MRDKPKISYHRHEGTESGCDISCIGHVVLAVKMQISAAMGETTDEQVTFKTIGEKIREEQKLNL